MTNKSLHIQAQKYLVGGVDSPVRSFRYAGISPILFKKGRGSTLFDYDGKSYIDYVLSFGAVILGHAKKSVVDALKTSLPDGFHFGSTHGKEVELAKMIIDAVPPIEKIRFVNSGTEAVMGAIRLARGYTKKNKIVKCAHSYHGHADYLLVEGGSGLATQKISLSDGVPRDFVRHTLVTEYGNSEKLEQLFKKHGDDIAAVIIEPVGGNYGVTAPNEKYLRAVRRITKKYKSLLIFDEVITGFRFHYGSFAHIAGVSPDIICLGKIIGGGLPIGAYGGKNQIMKHLAPLGNVYQASTFGGNHIVMSSGVSTLLELKRLRACYKRIAQMVAELSQTINDQGKKYNKKIKATSYGTMFSVRCGSQKLFQKMYKGLLDGGIYFAPSEYEANFISFSHTRSDLERTKRVIHTVIKNL